MCQRCKVKFFTPRELTDKRNEAQDFLGVDSSFTSVA